MVGYWQLHTTDTHGKLGDKHHGRGTAGLCFSNRDALKVKRIMHLIAARMISILCKLLTANSPSHVSAQALPN